MDTMYDCTMMSCHLQGISVEGQENIQELLTKQLVLCQYLCALMILRTGQWWVLHGPEDILVVGSWWAHAGQVSGGLMVGSCRTG